MNAPKFIYVELCCDEIERIIRALKVYDERMQLSSNEWKRSAFRFKDEKNHNKAQLESEWCYEESSKADRLAHWFGYQMERFKE